MLHVLWREDLLDRRFIAEHTVAVNHDHFFCYRLDLDVDGVDNSFFADRIETVKGKAKSLRKSWWVVRPQLLEHESEAKLHISMEKPALWRTVNPKLRGPGGYPVGFELRPGHSAMSLLDAADFPARRAGFARYSLWVTPYAVDERWLRATIRTRRKAGRAYRSGRATTGGSMIATSCSGTRSASTTWCAPRTGPSCRPRGTNSSSGRSTSSRVARRSISLGRNEHPRRRQGLPLL